MIRFTRIMQAPQGVARGTGITIFPLSSARKMVVVKSELPRELLASCRMMTFLVKGSGDLTGLPFGHVRDKVTLPVGQNARLLVEAEKGYELKVKAIRCE